MFFAFVDVELCGGIKVEIAVGAEESYAHCFLMTFLMLTQVCFGFVGVCATIEVAGKRSGIGMMSNVISEVEFAYKNLEFQKFLLFKEL